MESILMKQLNDDVIHKFNELYDEVIKFYKLERFKTIYRKSKIDEPLTFIDISMMGFNNYKICPIPNDTSIHTAFLTKKQYELTAPFQKFAINVIYNQYEDVNPEHFDHMNKCVKAIRKVQQ